MDGHNARQLIEDIISMPDSITAAEYAWSVRRTLLEPVCFRVLGEMQREAYAVNPGGKRYQALRRLYEYRIALFNNPLPSAEKKQLASLIVVPELSSFDKHLNSIFGNSDELDSKFNTVMSLDFESLNDAEKSIAFIKIQGLHLHLCGVTTSPKQTNWGIIGKLHSVLERCESLLQTGIGNSLVGFTQRHLQSERVQITETIARAYKHLKQIELAKEYYTEATAQHLELGNPERADRCQEEILVLERIYQAEFDNQLQRLLQHIDGIPEATLEYVETLVELGELCLSSMDDYQADEYFHAAAQLLKQMSFPIGETISDKEMMNTLFHSIVAIDSDVLDDFMDKATLNQYYDKQTETRMNITDLSAVYALHARLHKGLCTVASEASPPDYARAVQHLICWSRLGSEIHRQEFPRLVNRLIGEANP